MTREYSGTGLGLSIVKRIVQTVAGRDRFRERVGEGEYVPSRPCPGHWTIFRRSWAPQGDQREYRARGPRVPSPHEPEPLSVESERFSHDRSLPRKDEYRVNQESPVPPGNRCPPGTARPAVELYTDGGCSGNPGPGGWAYVLRHVKTGQEREDSGAEPMTTNNRMELMAVIRGLEALKKACRVKLVTDSSYVGKGLTEWMPRWKKQWLATRREIGFQAGEECRTLAAAGRTPAEARCDLCPRPGTHGASRERAV
jgi:ribonuclease HI